MTAVKPVKLAYDVFEPTSGADDSLSPVIYLHGVSGSKESWLTLPQTIADKSKRKGYAYDARNHGDSEHTDEYSFEMNTDDLFHFMDTIKAPKAVLVGASMGGMTSIKAALKRPERIEMIFVEDMFVKKCPKEIIQAVGGFISTWLNCVKTVPKEFDKAQAVKYCVDELFSRIPEPQQYLYDKEKLYTAGIDLTRKLDGEYDVKYNSKAILNAIANSDRDLEEPSGLFDGPACFIYGELSPFQVGKEEAHIKTFFPKAEMMEIKGCAHDVHVAFPEKVIETVVRYLNN